MKKIKGFTLAELSFVFVFIGVVSVIAMHTMNDRFVDFFGRYYTAYDSLSKAAYNTYIDTYCRTADDALSDCKNNKEKENGRPFPKNPKELCERLSEYLNKSEDIKCSNSVIVNALDNEFYDNKLKKKTNIQMALSNGFQLSFSPKKEIIINHAKTSNETIEYFIVYVDLNGSAKPNSTQLPHPDIVPFIVTCTGDVIPVGYPVYDKTYASARILDSQNNQTKSFTIDEARQLAFGNDSYIDIPYTLIPAFNNALPANIRLKNPDSRSDLKLGDENTEAMHCESGTFSCTLKIDETLGKRY